MRTGDCEMVRWGRGQGDNVVVDVEETGEVLPRCVSVCSVVGRSCFSEEKHAVRLQIEASPSKGYLMLNHFRIRFDLHVSCVEMKG
jgi:hypothetical protein